MSKLIPISERQRYQTFDNAADYLAKTGLHAPWNPSEPQRNWIAQPGDKGPFLLLPDIGGKSGEVDAVELNASPNSLLIPNIPSIPSVVPWTQPSHNVHQNGRPVSQTTYFPTIEEIEPALEEVNKLARFLGKPTLTDIRDGGFDGTFAYDYRNDPNLPEAKQRKHYVFSDTAGATYEAGEWLKKRYSKGKAIVEASVVNGKAVDVQKPAGSWGYTVSGGWQFIADWRLSLREPATSRIPPLGICIELRADETLYVSAVGLGFPMLAIKSGAGPIEELTGNGSATDPAVADLLNRLLEGQGQIMAGLQQLSGGAGEARGRVLAILQRIRNSSDPAAATMAQQAIEELSRA